MTSRKTHVVILAAGKGTRMRSERPKVLHEVHGRPMLSRVLDTARTLSPGSIVVVLGYKADFVRSAYTGDSAVRFVVQEPQLGTGHALMQALPVLAGATGDLLLLYGDVPLLTAETLTSLLARHREDAAAATVLTAMVPQPFGYGRVVREGGGIARIVEERDASADERAINEINAGIYALALEPLADAVAALSPANAQGEYYLTDLVGIYRRRGLGVSDAHHRVGRRAHRRQQPARARGGISHRAYRKN